VLQLTPAAVVIPEKGAFIVIHHHPHSCRRPEIIPLKQYIDQRTALEASANELFSHLDDDTEEIEKSEEQPPCWPLPTEADFDFLEFTRNTHLQNKQIDSLLQRHKDIWAPGHSLISFRNHRDVEKYEKLMVLSTCTTPVCSALIPGHSYLKLSWLFT
jgi:hypothetical protein